MKAKLLTAVFLCLSTFLVSPGQVFARDEQTPEVRGAEGRFQLAYEVNSIRASMVSGRDGSPWVRISVKGYAPHPGYRNPRLVRARAVRAENVLRLRFLLDPPDTNGMWPAVLTEFEAVALLPVQQQKRVRVRGFNNSVVARLDPTAPVFPSAWGEPPELQTKDWGRLPGRYGFGSSTLARWIKDKMQGN